MPFDGSHIAAAWKGRAPPRWRFREAPLTSRHLSLDTWHPTPDTCHCSMMNRARIVSALLPWFAQHARDLPWRRTRDPYAIWVSEIMLQQTQVKTVLPYWERWMRALPTIAALAKARPERIHKLWEGLGYYNRVRNMQKAAQIILEKHSGKFPTDFERVLALPGIGRYTAGAICSIAFNEPKPILDGNVIRVLTRLFAIAKNPRDKETNARLWRLAEQLVVYAASSRSRSSPPLDYKDEDDEAPRVTEHPSSVAALRRVDGTRNTPPSGASRFTFHVSPEGVRGSRFTPRASLLNQSLMELGALLCTPTQPQCSRCPVAKYCTAYQQGRVDQLPKLGPRPIVIPRRFVAFVAQHGDRFLVRQRPAGGVNAHLWEFPNLELTRADLRLRRAARTTLGFTPRALEPFCVVKHSITRYRITMDVFRASMASPANGIMREGNWVTLGRMSRLPFASAHRKILSRLV